MDSAEVAALVTYASASQQTTMLIVGSLAVLAYDYLLTLHLEIKHVWGAPLSVGNAIFYVVRYLPLIDTSLTTAYRLMDGSPDACKKLYSVAAVCYDIITVLAEIILALRTWAIWNKSRPCAVSLVVVGVGMVVPFWYSMIKFLPSMAFTTPPPTISGCFFGSASNIIYVQFILVMCYEALIFAATLAKGVQHLWRKSPVLITVLYRDGLMFSACMVGESLLVFDGGSIFTLFGGSVISVLNVIVLLGLQTDYVDILLTPHHVLHAIVSARIILHVREAANRPSTGGLTTTDGDVELEPIRSPETPAFKIRPNPTNAFASAQEGSLRSGV